MKKSVFLRDLEKIESMGYSNQWVVEVLWESLMSISVDKGAIQ